MAGALETDGLSTLRRGGVFRILAVEDDARRPAAPSPQFEMAVGRRKPRPVRSEAQPAPPPQRRALRNRLPGLRGALLVVLAACLVLGGALATRANRHAPATPVFGYEVVNVYPHDTDAFTQGLAFADGHLYEGTGQYRRSSLRQLDLESGKVLKYAPLDPRLFGEGITVWGNQIVQLTWRSRVGIAYDRRTFKPLGRFALRRGITCQEDLGQLVGLSQSTISKLESGNGTAHLSALKALRLADVIGEPLADIVLTYCSPSIIRLADQLAGLTLPPCASHDSPSAGSAVAATPPDQSKPQGILHV